jgi:OOP family OmpA-OmpF porin
MRADSLILLALLMFSTSVLAQSQQSIRDEVFGETDAVKRQADRLDAQLFAPETYAEGLELYLSANDRMERGRDLDRVRSELREAKALFQQSIEASELARTTFADALAAREAAKRAESERYAARDWRRAEEALTGAAETLEGGNLNRASRAAEDALGLYRESETKAIAAKARAAR